MIENSATPFRTGEGSSRRRPVKAAKSGTRSANCLVCAAPSLELCRKSRRHESLQASFTRLVNKAAQTGQFALRAPHVLFFFILLCSALTAKAQSGSQQ